MGALFSLTQADDDAGKQEILDWLKRIGRLPHENFKPGRQPTLTELRNAIDSFPDYAATYTTNQFGLDIHISPSNGHPILIHCNKFDGNESVPLDFYWKNDDEVIIPILQKLTLVCGWIIVSNAADDEEAILLQPPDEEL
jgi:hypothetical protein